jgi:hypothetical protein
MNRLPYLTEYADRHLTDEQIFALLDEQEHIEPTLQLHLLACPACAAELTTLRGSLANFRIAAINLASEVPPLAPRTAPAPRQRIRRRAWAASFATAAAMAALSIALIHPQHTTSGSQARPNAPAVQDVESDEALLDGIQQDLSTPIPPSLEPLALPAASNTHSTSN